MYLLQSNIPNDLVKKVFVAGLNKGNITEDDLRDYFNTFAKVKSVSIVIDKITLQSKGFAFVELENYFMVDKAARKAWSSCYLFVSPAFVLVNS